MYIVFRVSLGYLTLKTVKVSTSMIRPRTATTALQQPQQQMMHRHLDWSSNSEDGQFAVAASSSLVVVCWLHGAEVRGLTCSSSIGLVKLRDRWELVEWLYLLLILRRSGCRKTYYFRVTQLSWNPISVFIIIWWRSTMLINLLYFLHNLWVYVSLLYE